MKKYLLLLGLLAAFSACDQSTQVVKSNTEVHLLPQPKEISASEKMVYLSAQSQLYSPHTEVIPLLQLFSSEIQVLTGRSIGITDKKDQSADLIFELDTTMSRGSYHLSISDVIHARGGDYQALSMAKTSLLQMALVEEGAIKFPVLEIHDRPDASYRGLMIDLARNWHSVENIRQLIDLAALYKINYLQLHFTDDQSFTLPVEKYPRLQTPGRHYSLEELKEMEAYSKLRGVTIVPEIDVPGHSSPFVAAYPDIFAIRDADKNPRIINMGREEVYEALDYLVGEFATIFKSSPYFHIGGDEANFYKVMDDPEVQAYMEEKGLGNDVHELYRHFLIRMNDIVKKHNKQMCVWEGFSREGEIEIPKDILVFEFETNKYLPNHLIEDGYTVVNTSWKPLYVVNRRKWDPESIYGWNMWRWENWWKGAPAYEPIQLEKSPLVVGAQMCAWEQAEEVEIPSIRRRLPAFAERIWNTEKQISYETLMERLDKTDERLSRLIQDDRQDSLLVGYHYVQEMDEE